jgi:hypothetical protein
MLVASVIERQARFGSDLRNGRLSSVHPGDPFGITARIFSRVPQLTPGQPGTLCPDHGRTNRSRRPADSMRGRTASRMISKSER